MHTRTPAVAGAFYPGDAAPLRRAISGCVAHELGPKKGPSRGAVGIICPHAAYEYSGAVACHSFHAIREQRPDLFVMVGPNHSGDGCGVATMRDCTWQTPLGCVKVDSESADELSRLSGIEVDSSSHAREHSLEVQVPMLQQFFSHDFKILPIALADQDMGTAVMVGQAISGLGKNKNMLIIGSSDLTHYEPDGFARTQDGALIDAILGMDTGEFYGVLAQKAVSACGYGAIAATMEACGGLGATGGELLKYATSGDVSGDKTSVVGYCSIAFN